MDRMTTLNSYAVTGVKQLCANKTALLLPVLAVETYGISGHVSWLPFLLLPVTLAAMLVVPSVLARLAPYAMIGYGILGFFAVHSLMKQQTGGNPLLLSPSGAVIYGVVKADSYGSGAGFLLPQAFGFLAVGLWLLTRTDSRVGAAVRLAAHQLRGTGGQPRTVPPLLLLPVLFLWEEAGSSMLWFASPLMTVWSLVLGLIAVWTVRRWPQVAAVTAVLGLVGFGAFIAYGAALKWTQPTPGMLAGMYGFVLLDNPAARLIVVLEGLTFIGCGLALAPRMLMLGADAELIHRAQELTQRVTRLTETRSDATDTAIAELRRIERDLHDGAQARLVAVGMSLRAAEQLLATNPEAGIALVAEARETSTRALDDLRNLVRGVYPPVLADRGLADAVRALALDAPLDVDTHITLTDEPPMPVAAAVYFGVAEALTNAVRHSGADTVQIEIGYADGTLRATVIDDGQGGADQAAGTGLPGVERRLATFDGILAVSSPPGGPTIVAIEVPCALSDDSWSGPDRTWADVVRSSWRTRTLI
jgi:signal transduction histidine kinase